jgi:hypothetical protein
MTNGTLGYAGKAPRRMPLGSNPSNHVGHRPTTNSPRASQANAAAHPIARHGRTRIVKQ